MEIAVIFDIMGANTHMQLCVYSGVQSTGVIGSGYSPLYRSGRWSPCSRTFLNTIACKLSIVDGLHHQKASFPAALEIAAATSASVT